MVENTVRLWRESAGMSTAELARRIGVTPHKLGRVERNEVMLKAAEAARIAKVLGIDAERLLNSNPGDSPPEQNRVAGEMLPIYGLAHPMDRAGIRIDKDAIRGWVECPPAIREVDGAFAVWVPDDSMAPRYVSGELLFCHPYRPAAQGDDVMVVVAERGGAPSGRVRRLLAAHADVFELRTLNPEGTEIVQRELIRSMAVIVGMHPRGI